VAELRPRVPEIRAAGGDLVVVGTGAPFFAQGFRELLHLDDVDVLSDESLASYRLLGFKRGLLTFSLRSIAPYLRAFQRGQRQARTQGDALQQGGAIVVRPGGEIVYRFVSEVAGEHAPPDEVVEAVRRAAAAAAG
jgi:hypothetical protein